MATVTGLTAERMQQIIDKTIVDANVVSDNLILVLDDGSTIDTGNVRGPQGIQGAQGNTGAQGPQGIQGPAGAPYASPPVITSYAGLQALSPVDGQEVIYVADAAAGVIQRFRYRSAASGSYKWEFIGGSPLTNMVVADQGLIGDGVWKDPSTIGPVVSIALPGDYRASAVVRAYGNAAMNAGVGITVGAGDPPTEAIAFSRIDASGQYEQLTSRLYSSAMAAGSTLRVRYRADNGVMNVVSRWLEVYPVRVG